ncbi:MAG TPA: LuxR C-terminal-related transcriptional regulator [Gaiellaceae bacterium]|jgi:PAS domain S-box-containing protein|nr:LuxR C-terminal-related transcriptional regulator [Gaiellaceae bacterium]
MGRPRRPIDLTATLEDVNLPSFVTDRAGTVTWINDAARRAFGDLTARSLEELVAPEHLPRVQEALWRKLSGGSRATDYTVDVLTADGRRRSAEVSSVRIPNGDDCHAIFGIARPGPLPRPSLPGAGLTARQDEVLRLLAEGASTDDIARRLHLSKETVRNHIRGILRGLGAHSRLEAVAVAYASGLLE